jgi:hypothetical protein
MRPCGDQTLTERLIHASGACAPPAIRRYIGPAGTALAE